MRLADPDLQRFAAAIVHELRTPLSALTVEVELALRPERSAAASREGVARIADLVDDLFDQTRDLAALADGYDPEVVQLGTASLAAAVQIADRYPTGTVSIAVSEDVRSARLVGDEALLRRAIALLLDHAARHRPDGEVVRLEILPRVNEQTVILIVEGMPGGTPDIWAPLADEESHAVILGIGPVLRLQAAANMIRACGGTIRRAAGATALHVELRRALP